MSTISIWGLLIGSEKTSLGSPFRFEIGEAEDIFSLKEKVKETNNDMKDVPLRRLTVWKLCKPRQGRELTPNFLETIQLLKEGSEDMDKDTAALLLESTARICTQGPWADDKISVLVQVHPRGLTLSNSSGHGLSTTSDHGLQAVYNRSWGKPWSTRTATIDTALSDDMIDIDMTPINDGNGDLTIDPCTQQASPWKYTCLVDITSLAKACGITTSVPDVIVVRDEYIKLRQAMEVRKGSFVLTGQPGIGKTIFLIYLLLHRLESKLPTAIQFGPRQYILFDGNGAEVHHHANSKLPDSCWALTDSNVDVTIPCLGFRAAGARIVQTTSPRLDRWKGWSKYSTQCSTIIVDLPKRLEIAAIAQEMGYDPSTALAHVDTWGPCTRTIVKILQDSSFVDKHANLVRGAAAGLGSDNLAIQTGDIIAMESRHSPLVFIFPIRDPTPSSKCGRCIPTPKLLSIYEETCQNMSNKAALNLFEMLSMHPLTRAGPGWRHEKQMHLTMTRCSHPLEIVSLAGELATMQPTRRLLPLTQGALKRERSDNRAFYWFPPNETFEGIDGVLADPANIFVLQATISGTHRSPLEGLCKIWALLGPNSKRRLWHFVTVVDDEQLAMDYVTSFGKELAELCLGNARVQVSGCVLPKTMVARGMYQL